MRHSESIKAIAGKLALAQADFGKVAKGGENPFDKYSYATLENILDAAKPVLTKHGIVLVTSVNEIRTAEPRQSEKGKPQFACYVHLLVRLIDSETGEWIEVDGWGEGQDRADKAVYKATTGARKYAIAAALNLVTTDDPEKDEGTRDRAGRAPKAGDTVDGDLEGLL